MKASLTPEQRVLVAQIKDLTVSRVSSDEPFLHHLPHLLEQGIVDPALAKSCLKLTQRAIAPDRPPLLDEALKILNQLVSISGGSLHTPQPFMFEGTHFRWSELGDRTDAQSVMMHILNKTVLFLNVSKG